MGKRAVIIARMLGSIVCIVIASPFIAVCLVVFAAGEAVSDAVDEWPPADRAGAR